MVRPHRKLDGSSNRSPYCIRGGCLSPGRGGGYDEGGPGSARQEARAMRVEFYGLMFETPCVSFYLWSPWRSTALEHKLFEAVRGLPNTRREDTADELRVHITDPKT